MPAGGRSPAPLSVHRIRSGQRPSAGDGGHLSSRHRISTAFQYAGSGSDYGPLQALTWRSEANFSKFGSRSRARTSASRPQQLIERDREVAHPLAGRMIDRIRDCGRRADNADFANTFDPKWIDLIVLLFDEDHVDRMHVGIHRHVVVGEIVGHESSEPVVGGSLLM